jgi:hypothetical protein
MRHADLKAHCAFVAIRRIEALKRGLLRQGFAPNHLWMRGSHASRGLRLG